MGDSFGTRQMYVSQAKWPSGIVVQMYPDKAGWVRQVDVRVRTRCIRRHIAKLCFMDIGVYGIQCSILFEVL